MPTLKHRIEKTRPLEGVVLAAVLVLSLLIQRLILPEDFVGPDYQTYLSQGRQAQSAELWFDPTALGTNYWPVGYPAFLAAVLSVFGGSLRAVQYVQLGLALTLAPLAWLITRHISIPVRMVTFTAVALSPSVIWAAQNAGYEVLLSFLLCLSLACIWGRGGAPSGNRYWLGGLACAISGLAFGSAFLVQNKVLIVLPALIFLAVRWGRRSIITFSVVALLAPTAWAIRNLAVVGTFSPITNNASMNLWIGNNPLQTTGGFMEPPPVPIEPILGLDIYASNALNYFITQPEASFALFLRKAARLLEPVFIYPNTQIFSGQFALIHWFTIAMSIVVLVLFAAFAFGRLWVRPPSIPNVGPVSAFVLLFGFVHLPFLAEARFRVPVEPLVICVAVPTAFYLAKSIARGTRVRL